MLSRLWDIGKPTVLDVELLSFLIFLFIFFTKSKSEKESFLIVFALLVHVVLSTGTRVKIWTSVKDVLLDHAREFVVFSKGIKLFYEVPSCLNRSKSDACEESHEDSERIEASWQEYPLPVSKPKREG